MDKLTREQIEEWLKAAERMPQDSEVRFLEFSDFVALLRMALSALTADAGMEAPCRHEWYQGYCAHCEINATEWRNKQAIRAASAQVNAEERESSANTYWMIERGSPCEWWVGNHRIPNKDGGEWTTDSAKAQHFTEWGAKQHAKELESWGIRGPLRATEHMDMPATSAPDAGQVVVPDGFSRTDLEDVAEALETGYEKSINVGEAIEKGFDVHVESTTAYAARFIRAMLRAAGSRQD